MKISNAQSIFFGLIAAVIIIVLYAAYNHKHDILRRPKYEFSFKSNRKASENRPKSSHITDPIPSKIIHQSWKVSKLPKRFQKWSKTWKNCFPSWKYKLWNDTENRDFIVKYYPWFVKTYDDLGMHISRADSLRYIYLFHFGGIYSDLDNECIRPFEHLLTNHSLVFGAMEGQYGGYIKEGYVQNSFMYSRPHHPFWLEMLHEITKRVKSPAPPEAIAGPITLVHCINSYRKRFQKDIIVYPPKFFNPNSWLKPRAAGCKDFNAMTEEEEAQCRKHYSASYVIQYHTQTWGRGKGKVTRRVK